MNQNLLAPILEEFDKFCVERDGQVLWSVSSSLKKELKDFLRLHFSQAYKQGAMDMGEAVRLREKYTGLKREDDLFHGYNKAIEDVEWRISNFLKGLEQ